MMNPLQALTWIIFIGMWVHICIRSTALNERFGWKRPDGSKEFSKWSDFIIQFAANCVNKVREYSLFLQADIDLFWQVINNNKVVALLDEIKQPRMAYADLWQGNVLLEKRDGKYSIAALIDIDRAIFGDVYWDFITQWMITDSFLSGYGGSIDKSLNTLKRGDIYLMLGYFVSTYIWAVQYDTPKRYEHMRQEAIKYLHRCPSEYLL